jgi:hypothetical protein
MNVVTYASPVALQPPVYALGLYKDTQSWRNWRTHRRGLLQAGAADCSGPGHVHPQIQQVLTRSTMRRTSRCLCYCSCKARGIKRLPTCVAQALRLRRLAAEILTSPSMAWRQQILRRQHAELVQLLGKTSARDVDKLAALADMGFGTVDRLGYASLAGACRPCRHCFVTLDWFAAEVRMRVAGHLCWWQLGCALSEMCQSCHAHFSYVPCCRLRRCYGAVADRGSSRCW